MIPESTSDTWIPACDLCGNLDHEIVASSSEATVRRCRECGLVSITHACGTCDRSTAPARMPEDIATAAVKRLRGYPRSMLVVGLPSPELAAAAAEAGVAVTALVESSTQSIPGVTIQRWSLESAAFGADTFDLIICSPGLDAFGSPSLLFERASRWLTPGGTLLVGALNAQPLAARLRMKQWLNRQAPTTRHLFTPTVLADYARRFGFNVASARTRSHIGEVASAVTGREHAPWLTELAMAPVALASSVLGMGVLLVVEMRRGGLATRPALRSAEDAIESAPGLAPALYTSAHREHTAEYA